LTDKEVPNVGEALHTLAAYLTKESGVPAGFCLAAMTVKFEAARLLCRKQKVYGPHNINAAGLVGIAVQMMNKAGRLLTMGARLVQPRPAIAPWTTRTTGPSAPCGSTGPGRGARTPGPQPPDGHLDREAR
jgi:hypothetical protein